MKQFDRNKYSGRVFYETNHIRIISTKRRNGHRATHTQSQGTIQDANAIKNRAIVKSHHEEVFSQSPPGFPDLLGEIHLQI